MKKEIRYIGLHHTAVQSTTSQLKATDKYHKQKYNMLSELGYYVGYHYFIDRKGVITQTRNHGEESAAIRGHNTDTLSICLQGDFNLYLPSEAQIRSLRALVQTLKRTYKKAKFVQHKDLQRARTCAGALISSDFMVSIEKPYKLDKVDAEKKRELTKQLEKAKTLLTKLLELWRK